MTRAPRISAAILIFIFLAAISLVVINASKWGEDIAMHGSAVEYQHGFVESLGPGPIIVFKTETGAILHLQCTARCLTELHHVQRHITEKAPTDLYYIENASRNLVALDID
jgi:hypothetical protein